MTGQQRDALFRGVFDAVPDAVVIVDRDGRIVLANAQCRSVFGWDRDELVGRPVETLVPAAVRDEHPRRRDSFFEKPDPRPMGLLRLAAVRRDGTEFPAEISLAPIEIDGVAFVSATVRDISARLRDEERFRDLLEAAPDATVIVDASARIVLANNQVSTVLGYDRRELVGQSLAVLVPDRMRGTYLQIRDDFLTTPGYRPMGFGVELWARRKGGREIPVEISVSPLETDEGLLVSVALRDVTAQRRIVKESQRLRDELIATVSHELRTPLTSIIGYTELMLDLEETDLSRRARKLLAVIERNAARELHLVDDLLTMAFLDDNRLRIASAPVDLCAVGRRVVDDHSLRARERGLRLTLVAEEVAPVSGDFYRLVQVLENLVTNALKFTRPGGHVEVSVGGHAAMATLEVRDTGVGVSPEEKAQLFDRLYRAPGAVESQAQGAGLGLSIVRAIVDAHGGRVEVDSQVGVGTVVRVTLPYADPEPVRAAATGR